MTNSTMWVPNIADFAKDYRVYAIDVMGQPTRSVPDPDAPIRDPADLVAWLGETLDGLNLDRFSLVGMSFGGWLALHFSIAVPERVQKLVLLSPAASLQPIVRQMGLRAMLTFVIPSRLMVNAFFGWMGFKGTPGDTLTRSALDLGYLGAKHYRFSPETASVMPAAFSDDELRALYVPALLLIGDREVIYDPAKALARAQALIPNLRGELVPGANHNMCASHYQLVDARVLDFLNDD
jgi:pimeloyl-ACP methyl ester carboxylesterase